MKKTWQKIFLFYMTNQMMNSKEKALEKMHRQKLLNPVE